jgi:CRISPR/Cas system CSM-associated protein Csm2 small subunit
MNKSLSIIVIFIFSVIVLKACKEVRKNEPEKNIVEKPINPNGDSELALLMREMFADIERVKQQVQNEEVITVKIEHKKILTAHATEPDKAASSEFKTLGDEYLNSIEKLIKSSPENTERNFTNLVNHCMSCHTMFCPGPIKKIKKLNLSSMN